VQGDCPSFVSVEGGVLRRAETPAADFDAGVFAGLPEPTLPATSEPYDILIAGIGGTGVVTLGSILAMAAHLEGKGSSELDVTGLAQKNGAVASHVRIADASDRIFATRIAAGGASLVLGCDPVVATNPEHLPAIGPRTIAIINRYVAPTSDFARDADLDLSFEPMQQAVRSTTGDGRAHFPEATAWATALLGDAIGTNLFLLGYAWQLGHIPVSLEALERAIELNGRSVELNRRALAWGRLAAHDPSRVEELVTPLRRGFEPGPGEESLSDLLALRIPFLTAYRNARYARRFEGLVDRVAECEKERLGSEELARTVARYYFKLLAYKDEYEVARLYTDGVFLEQIEREFESARSLRFHVAMPFLPSWLVPRDPEGGRTPKWRFPKGFLFPVWKTIRFLRFLRGTPLDPFGWTAERRLERKLPRDYEATVAELVAGLNAENHGIALEIAAIPELIRGFGGVKERHLHDARAKERELLDAFRRRIS
jgi:indolepyruvate ferredoxin oxidoreductase